LTSSGTTSCPGEAKALWTLFLIVAPWLGALVYLIVRAARLTTAPGSESAQRAGLRPVLDRADVVASLDAYAPAIERRRVDLALFGDRIFVNNASLGAYATAVQSDSSWTTPGFEVNPTEPLIDIGVDGEALRLPPPLRFRSLFVRAHPHAGARSRR
jgi:hypothetical protein